MHRDTTTIQASKIQNVMYTLCSMKVLEGLWMWLLGGSTKHFVTLYPAHKYVDVLLFPPFIHLSVYCIQYQLNNNTCNSICDFHSEYPFRYFQIFKEIHIRIHIYRHYVSSVLINDLTQWYTHCVHCTHV